MNNSLPHHAAPELIELVARYCHCTPEAAADALRKANGDANRAVMLIRGIPWLNDVFCSARPDTIESGGPKHIMKSISAHVHCKHAGENAYYASAAYPICEECVVNHAYPMVYFTGEGGHGGITIDPRDALHPERWAELESLITGRTDGKWKHDALSLKVETVDRGGDEADIDLTVCIAGMIRLNCDITEWSTPAQKAARISKRWYAVHLYHKINAVSPGFMSPEDLLRLVDSKPIGEELNAVAAHMPGNIDVMALYFLLM